MQGKEGVSLGTCSARASQLYNYMLRFHLTIGVIYLGQEVGCFLFGLVKGFCLLYCLFNVKRVFANGPIRSIFVGLKALQ